MLDTYHQEKVALNLKLFVIKKAKCKQGSILTSMQNTTSLYKNTILQKHQKQNIYLNKKTLCLQ
jgi:hypothetical protein